MTLEQAETIILEILKQVMEESVITNTNVEMATVTARVCCMVCYDYGDYL